jgi:hypothetical protein
MRNIVDCYHYVLLFILVFIGYNSAIAQETSDTTHTVNLSEVTVEAKLVKRTADGDQYLITNQMREMGLNSFELLACIPGLQLNRALNQILINNKSNILFLVNGRSQSKDFIMTISPETIKLVKVIQNPKGRYSSEGYDAVIEIITRKAEGWDVNLSNMLLVNPSKNNGSNHVLMEQPAFNIGYTHSKVSVYASGGYGTSKWNTPVENELRSSQSILDDIPLVSGIEKYGYNGRLVSAGFNYQISKNHVLSFDYDFLHENDKISSDMKGSSLNYYQLDHTCRKSNTYTLYYKGRLADKLSLYSDFSVNNYKNDYTNQSDDFADKNRERRDAIDFTTDLLTSSLF